MSNAEQTVSDINSSPSLPLSRTKRGPTVQATQQRRKREQLSKEATLQCTLRAANADIHANRTSANQRAGFSELANEDAG